MKFKLNIIIVLFAIIFLVALHLFGERYLELPSLVMDYIKATVIFIALMTLLFSFYQSYRRHINTFLKKHFLVIKGFGILYVAILAIVPVLKNALVQYGQLSPYHHVFIYLVIIIIFFCIFISSFDENIMGKEFHISELFVCSFLCIMGLALFFCLMESPG